jgi:hypothetical protein
MDEEKEDDWVEIDRRLYFHASRNLDGENLTEMPSNGWTDCSPTRSTHGYTLAVRRESVT